MTIGGTYTGLVETSTYTFKREEFAPIYTLQGIQDPLALFSGPVSLAVSDVGGDDGRHDLQRLHQPHPADVEPHGHHRVRARRRMASRSTTT